MDAQNLFLKRDATAGKYFYIIFINGGVKIGITKDLKERLSQHKRQFKNKFLQYHYTLKLDNAYNMEQYILNNLKEAPIKGQEYFNLKSTCKIMALIYKFQNLKRIRL